jgi:hypothetical protein
MLQTFTAICLSLLLVACGTVPKETQETPAAHHSTWQPVEDRVGWWVHEQADYALIVAMMNDGLMFIAFSPCPTDTPKDHSEAIWFAGDTTTRKATDCHDRPVVADVRFHLSPEFAASLPILPRTQYFETIARRRHR